MTSAWDLDSRFRDAVAALAGPDAEAEAADPGASIGTDSDLTGHQVAELFDAQLTSRQLDLAAYWLRSWGEGYYAVSSAGHEGLAAVAAALRPTDPALLCPRSGGFYCARGGQVSDSDPIRDVVTAVVGATTDPMSGGRHEPYGSASLAVLPTSSNGSSHLPRALGLAFGAERARRLGVVGPALPDGAVVVATFAGREVNHATTAAAMNAAGWCEYAGLPVPLLFVCQDDTHGVGGTATWVADLLESRPGVKYFAADGCDVAETYRVASDAVRWVRDRRRPAVLHLDVVRLLGGATPDVSRDPLLRTAKRLVSAGVATPDELLRRYDDIGWRVRKAAERAVAESRLNSAREVTAPLSPRRPVRVAQTAATAAEPDVRADRFGERLPEDEGPLTLAQALNRTLCDALAAYPRLVVFGPEVVDGGRHGVTGGLRSRFGAARVFDTFADETAVCGLAFGCGLAGLVPVAELPRLAALHNAAGQLRDEAAPTQFFSNGQYRNPLVLRVPGFAALDGNGGHTENENAIGALREIPGLVLATPARPDDAAAMLRTCIAAANTDGSCVVFVEPTQLYHARDLYAEGDGEWLAAYPAPDQWASSHAPIGRARVYGDGDDLTIVTYGDGLWSSLRVRAQLAGDGIGCRVMDLRWLAPLPTEDLVREATATGRVLVVDQARRSGGIADAVVASLVAAGFTGPVTALTSEDSYIPLGTAARHVLVAEHAVAEAARTLVARPL